MKTTVLSPLANCHESVKVTLSPGEAIRITTNALEGATLRANRSRGWERTRALARCASYRQEIAKLSALSPSV